MLMNEFEDWRRELDSDYTDKKALREFLDMKYCLNGPISDFGLDMCWSIYQLQICFEGFLEEMDIKDGISNAKLVTE